MRFTKMQGIGNDYVYVNGFTEQVADPAGVSRAISDRHFGVGSDGLILVLPSEKAAVRMRMFNADGSESQMCGNGLRCVARYAWEHKLVRPEPAPDGPLRDFLESVCPDADRIEHFIVETGAGCLPVMLAIRDDTVIQVALDMGKPILLPIDIPVNVTGQQAVGVPLQIMEQNLLMTCVSMGNPHAVFFCHDVDKVDLEELGPAIECHKLFSERINVHFAQVIGPAEVRMRTWERGSGITLACGTGAAAVCVAGVLASKAEHGVRIHLPGGDLTLLWNQQNQHVYQAGAAEAVFEGDWPDSVL